MNKKGIEKENNVPLIVQRDSWLIPHTKEIQDRIVRFGNTLEHIKRDYTSLSEFASAYKYMGLHFDALANGWRYREWAPNAREVYLIGDFNNWDRRANPLTKNINGTWEVFVSATDYNIFHLCKYKVHIVHADGSSDRIPAYAQYVVQDEQTMDFSAVVWKPKQPFIWTEGTIALQEIKEMPLIYECHTGMAQEKEGIGSYREFADSILPKIKKLGYNAIQLMAVHEHPYYGSFGYHVSNFFAPSSRFGTPDDLKYLVNTAHTLNIAVIIDLVHSHAIKNRAEGLHYFDGTEDLYFHKSPRGVHEQWDSLLFDYGKKEVKQFLLSNIQYWLQEFHFDGFRFDGVTSLLYFHHGNTSFQSYDDYFTHGVDWDALIYLQLANELIHTLRKENISIAEDMSGMPGLASPIQDGGVGFDFRLAMGIPDFWIKLLKEKKDEEWDMHELFHTLKNRRWGEKNIAYSESHDQALVGDKTIAFWLMDKEMYFDMHKDHHNIIIDRGIALHKMIRLISLAAGGEGYLNFMGNEFGHPEWVDFPREGNNWTYKYARRQWSLSENKDLRYQFLNNFDAQMIQFAQKTKLLNSPHPKELNIDTTNKALIFERRNYIFFFNWHSHNSIPDYRFYVPEHGKYKIILNSDKKEFGGFERIDDTLLYSTIKENNTPMLSVYAPNRCCFVLEKYV